MDAETMEAIEKWAADEFRSTNGQLQWIIAEALRKSGRMKKKKTIIKKEEKEWQVYRETKEYEKARKKIEQGTHCLYCSGL